MEEHKKRITGSIADRMIVLLIAGMVLVSVAFIGANIYRSRVLSKLTMETNQQQIDSGSLTPQIPERRLQPYFFGQI